MLFIYLFLFVLGLWEGFFSSCGKWGLLIVVASFVAEQGLLNLQASVELGLSNCGTWA